MGVEISPFQRLVCLSDNFKIALDEAGGSVEKVFLRSVETPSEAFFFCPKKISRLFYRVWGFVRSFFGWDTVRKYDQEANILVIRTLFQEALSDLPHHEADQVRRVIEFVTTCDRLVGTDKGRVIFANYVLGLKKLTPPIPEDILRFLFQEKLSPEQLNRVCSLADDLFAANISTLQTILPTWEKIRAIKVGEIPALPQTSRKMVEQLAAASQGPLSERYKIFCAVRDFLTPDQKKEIVKAWVAPLDPQKPPLIDLKDRLVEIGGTQSVLPLDVEAFRAVFDGYRDWLQGKKKTLQDKEAIALAQGLFDLNDAFEQQLSQIVLVCPQSFREELISAFRRVTIQEMKPLLLKIKEEAKVPKKSYEEASQSHHQLTSMKGQLLSLPKCDERSECLQQLDKLLKELDAYLEKENPGAHVVEGAST